MRPGNEQQKAEVCCCYISSQRPVGEHPLRRVGEYPLRLHFVHKGEQECIPAHRQTRVRSLLRIYVLYRDRSVAGNE